MKLRDFSAKFAYPLGLISFLLISLCISGCARDLALGHALSSKQSYEKKDYNNAIQLAKQSTEFDPTYAPGWYWLGTANYEKGNYGEAISALKKVIELRPTGDQFKSSYFYLGMSYYSIGNYDVAISNFNKKIELDPQNAAAHSMRGLSYYNKSSFNEAISDFSRAIELNPKDEGPYHWRGCSYYEKSSFDEAINNFSRAIELNPKGARSYHWRGWAYYKKSSFNEAISDFNRTTEKIDPKNNSDLRSALRGKAFSYLGLGDSDTAVNLIKKAKETLDYDTGDDLALIYYAMGDKKKAWQYRGGSGMIGLNVKDYKKGEVTGAEVVKVLSSGPAAKANMLIGDVIVKVNQTEIREAKDLLRTTAALTPYTSTRIRILREGIEKQVTLEVASAEMIMEQAPVIAPLLAKSGGMKKTAKSEDLSLPFIRSDVDELPPVNVKSNRNAYAIVIGIEQYRQKLPKADFAVSDAKLMSEYLSRVMGYPEENVVILINELALKSDFEKYFEQWLFNKTEKGSTVFIYYSGHGAPSQKTGDAYLVPYDGDPSFIDQTGYPLKKMYDALGKLPAKEIIVVLDSCFSGAGGRSVLAKGTRPLVMNLGNIPVTTRNMTIMAAASSNQISSTYDEKGHGLFTYFMLKGIKNEEVVKQDGSIAISDLFSYLKPRVERIARRQYNNEQTPQLIEPKKN